MQVFDHGVRLMSKGVVEPRDTKEKAARSLDMVLKSQSCLGITVSLEPRIESTKLRWNSVETVRSWQCTMESPNHFLLFDSPERSRFPKLGEGGEDDRQNVGHSGIPQSAVSVRQ